MFRGVSNRVFARADIPFTPRSDNFEARVERHDGEFEAHLVVALAGRAVRDRVRANFVSHVHKMFGDQWARDGRAEQIFMFVYRAHFQHRKKIIAGEFLFHVVQHEPARAALDGFLFKPRHVFVALSHVRAKTNDFTAVIFLQPRDDHRCVQPA